MADNCHGFLLGLGPSQIDYVAECPSMPEVVVENQVGAGKRYYSLYIHCCLSIPK